VNSSLKSFSRIVVKIGSASLVDQKTGIRHQWLRSLIQDVAELTEHGTDVIIVSSGSIALGRRMMTAKGITAATGNLALEESQAAASIGQIALCSAYSQALGDHGLTAAQILLTLGDTEERRRYLNARDTITTALKWKAVPIINENDSVATAEIRYGDNDRLAARVASMVGADLLVLLSDIDGLYTAPPHQNPDAKHIPVVAAITPEIEAMAGLAASEFSRGGMKTKIEAARIATAAGAAMIITSADQLNPLSGCFRPVQDRRRSIESARRRQEPVAGWGCRGRRRFHPRRHCENRWAGRARCWDGLDGIRFGRRAKGHGAQQRSDLRVHGSKRADGVDSPR